MDTVGCFYRRIVVSIYLFSDTRRDELFGLSARVTLTHSRTIASD